MAYVKIETGGVSSFAECPAETAAHLQETAAPGTVVTISETPFLPQAKNAAMLVVKDWSTSQGITPASAPELIGQVLAARASISAAADLAAVDAAVAGLTAPVSASLAVPIRRECERRINAALGSPTLQASMDRERGVLNKLHAKGVPLTPEQQAEEVLLDLINDWETAMIAIRESLIAAADPTFAADGHWYAPPEGLAARILASF